MSGASEPATSETDLEKEISEGLFNDGEFEKLLKLYDAKGGMETLLESPIDSERYILSCFNAKKPRKLSMALKKFYASGNGKEIIEILLNNSLDEDREGEIRTIRKTISGDREMETIVDSMVLDRVLRDSFRPSKFSTSMMKEMISNLLENEGFYSIKQSSETLESLRLRVQKLYRGKRYERVISWLEGVSPRDENFQSFKFLLLSYRSIGEDEKGVLLAKESAKKIKDQTNFDSILDFLYTVGDNEGLIESVEVFGRENASFRSNFIIARTLRRMGDIGGSERIINDSKKDLLSRIENDEITISDTIQNIKQIGFSGDIETSENLLHKLISKDLAVKEIINDGKGFEIIDLFRDTLDRQKRIRLRDSLVLARILVEKKKFGESVRLLNPYIIHGIRDSAELFELFITSANGSKQTSLVMDLIEDCTESMEPATIDRIAHILEVNGMFHEHRRFTELVPSKSIDSFKFLRSYFNVVERDTNACPPKDILIRISKKADPIPESVIYFIERYSRFADPSDISGLVKTLRIDRLTRIYCTMRIGKFGSDHSYLEEVFKEILSLDKDEDKKKNFKKMIEEFINVCHSNNEDEWIIRVLERFELTQRYDKKLTSAYIRSLISLGEFKIVEDIIEEFSDYFPDIERWRIMIEIGNINIAKKEMKEFQEKGEVFGENEVRTLKSIYFKLGMFREYLEITSNEIMKGNFTLSELTRHYYSLYKLGEDKECMKQHNFLQSHYCHFAEKRAILAIAGYDFGLSKDFLGELTTAVMMDPNRTRVPLLIAKSFLALERPDVAFQYLKHSLKIGQRDREVIEVGRRIQQMMIDLEIKPMKISDEQIVETPIFTDVEVLRRLMKEKREVKLSSKKSSRKRIAVHSHTLDIGGAERQASLLVDLMENNSIKNSGFSLVTHRIPNKSSIDQTYYRNLIIESLDVIEYIKPVTVGEISEDVDRIVGHLSSVKARRLRNLIRIFSEGDYDIAHTWQDYCNIYGGIAALISGVQEVVMSARTMPPPQKGKLAARQGRSYLECYRILLNSERVILTHNSDFGNEKYVEWLEVPSEKNITIHNGVDVAKWADKPRSEFNLRKEIGLDENTTIVGYVGRFTTDKRPWLFLKIAEEILSTGGGQPRSRTLEEWYFDNEGKASGSNVGLGVSSKLEESINFVMLGDGAQFDKARDIVEESEILSGRVHFVGFTDKVSEYLRNFDCFLLTSKIEGLPNVVIEAQACGIPVLSTNAGGSKECIIEGETGLISYDDSPLEMCKQLHEILTSKSFKKNTRKSGSKFIEKKFGIKTYSKNMNKLYSR